MNRTAGLLAAGAVWLSASCTWAQSSGKFQPESAAVAVEAGTQAWPVSMPLGGIGTGGFEILPNGAFANFTLHNTWDRPVVAAPGTFIAVHAKTESGGGAARIVRVSDPSLPIPFPGVTGFVSCAFRSLYPFGEWGLADSSFPVQVKLSAWSSLYPGKLKESSLPLGVVEVRLYNPGKRPVAVSAALSWQDLNGRGGSFLEGDQFEDAVAGLRRELSTTSGLTGVVMSPRETSSGRHATFRGDVFVGVAATSGVATRLLSWDPLSPSIPWWPRFEKSGRVDSPTSTRRGRSNVVVGFTDAPHVTGNATVVALRTHVGPGETVAIPFVVAWHMPQIVPAVPDQAARRPAYVADFPTIDSLVGFVGPRLDRLRAATQQWQALVLASNVPLSVRALALQSVADCVSKGVRLDTLSYRCLEVPGRGRGMMGGMDLRFPSRAVLAGLYPELDRQELLAFAGSQAADGCIPRHYGDVHGGYQGLEREFIGTGCLDPVISWVMQVAAYWKATGDLELVKQVSEELHRAGAFMEKAEVSIFHTGLIDLAAPGETAMMRAVGLTAALQALADMDHALGNSKEAERWEGEAAGLRKTLQLRIQEATTSPDGTSSGTRPLSPWSFGAYGQAVATALRPPVSYGDVQQGLAAADRTFKSGSTELLRPHGGMNVPSKEAYPYRRSLPLAVDSLAATSLRAGMGNLGWGVMRQAMEVAMQRPAGPWFQPLFEDTAGARQDDYFSGHRAAQPWWRLMGDLSGLALDVPEKTLYIDPPNEISGLPVVEVPVFNASFWGWWQWDQTSGTLTVLKVPGVPLSLQKLAVRRSPEGSVVGETTVKSPVVLKPGVTLRVRMNAEGAWDYDVGHRQVMDIRTPTPAATAAPMNMDAPDPAGFYPGP